MKDGTRLSQIPEAPPDPPIERLQSSKEIPKSKIQEYAPKMDNGADIQLYQSETYVKETFHVTGAQAFIGQPFMQKPEDNHLG